jgi:hypothetical protein
MINDHKLGYRDRLLCAVHADLAMDDYETLGEALDGWSASGVEPDAEELRALMCSLKFHLQCIAGYDKLTVLNLEQSEACFWYNIERKRMNGRVHADEG